MQRHDTDARNAPDRGGNGARRERDGCDASRADLANEPSQVGEIDHPARQLRDPAIIRDQGKAYLFYTFCGEQGIAGADVNLVP